MVGDFRMRKKYNSNSKQRNEKSSATYVVRINKAQKRVNKAEKQGDQKTALNKAIEFFIILKWIVIILIVILILFFIFTKLFSTLHLFLRVFIVASATFPMQCKIVKKFNWVRTFLSQPDVKTVVKFFYYIKSIFKRFYNRNEFVKKACKVMIFPIVVSFVISFFPKISAAANNAVDYALNTIFEVIDDSGAYEKGNKDDISVPPEEGNIYTETINYPLKMTFIINSERYFCEIPANLIHEVYLYSVENPREYFNSIYNTEESSQNNVVYYKEQKKEDEFVAKVNDGIRYKTLYGQNDTWYNLLPKEEELRSIINKQEEKAKTYPSYHIYNCLSNNYQRLALEYYNQEQNTDIIKYLYLMSIKYEIKSMEYATEREQLYKATERIITRYEDILFCCECTSTETSYLQTLLSLLKS